MPFVFEGGPFGGAVDAQRHMSIRPSRKFLDVTSVYIYELMSDEIRFEFNVGQVTQERTFFNQVQGKEQTDPLCVGAYIIENTVAIGFAWATGARSSSLTYDEIKGAIREGIFEIFSHGGSQLEFVPDFRVGFVADADEMKVVQEAVWAGRRAN